MAYHVPWRNGSCHRQTVVTELRLDADGEPVPIDPVTDPGLVMVDEHNVVLDASAVRWAQEFSHAEGAVIVPGPRTAGAAELPDGAFLVFSCVDFSSGIHRVWLELHGEDSARSGSLLFCLDGPKGTVFAKVDCHDGRTGRYTAQTADVRGRHSLVIRAVCDAGALRLLRFGME